MNILEKIKNKKEFSELPDSIVSRAADSSGGDVKKSRALLRKYFGVFLTNKILKGKGAPDEVLKFHLSSRKRNYKKFYKRIFEIIKETKSIIDLGCGANGYSYTYLKPYLQRGHYLGIEAVGQIVKNTNNYFKDRGFENAHIMKEDLFNIKKILLLEKQLGKPRTVFLFQVIDALENLEKDFSKKFILEISRECENIVLTLSTESLGGRKKFIVRRKWLVDFLHENFEILEDFEMEGERIICLKK